MLPYFSAVVPVFFCCLHISAFNLSSTCLLASLIASSLQGRPGFLGIQHPGHFNNEYTVSFMRKFEYRYTGF